MLVSSFFNTHPLLRTTGPRGDMDLFRRQLDQLFARELAPTSAVSAAGWPRANLIDTGDAYELSLAVPGVKAEDLEITFANEELILKGERKTEIPEGYKAQLRERGPVKFMRQFSLPPQVDGTGVTAKLQDGVLVIRLPRKAEHKPRTIAIQS